jgi:hypothetical protein
VLIIGYWPGTMALDIIVLDGRRLGRVNVVCVKVITSMSGKE